ncbi:hypothetical protein M422DRAFT_248093 [Sphaerobolus stellatus SS14]|nr:hypothetical protein M422DRAFT_248093 [Sphaerobolus stellatus SS14]
MLINISSTILKSLLIQPLSPRSQFHCLWGATTGFTRPDDVEASPKRPFPFHDPKDWLGAFLARPDIEDIMDSRWTVEEKENASDVFDAEYVKTLLGPDGRPFCIKGSEGRYLFAVPVDWYNPFENKQSGMHAAFGVISLTCLNLLVEIRYKWENTFLAGIIPGPGEPSLEEVNHLLVPLFRIFAELWQPGIFFTRTAKFAMGRLIWCAIVPFVADMKGSRKTSGSKQCPLCLVQHADVIAHQWLHASTAIAQENIYKKHGIRWTPFLLLPYWDPTKLVVVDPMHALFEGVVQAHVRYIYEMNSEGAEEKVAKEALPGYKMKTRRIKALEDDDVEEIMEAWNEETLRESAINNKPYAALEKACEIFHIQRTQNERGKITRLTMITDLIHAHRETPSYEQEAQSLPREITEIPTIPLFTVHTLLEIRKDIARTVIPTWMNSVPQNFGSKRHGKLKADEWRTMITVYLPITLGRLWGSKGTYEQFKPYYNNTMMMVCAVVLATSKEISHEHVKRVLHYLQEYLTGLKELFTDLDFRDNHHVVLHIPEILISLGPMHSWWMFPFVRLIGRLQRISTNWMIGQMEVTVMRTFTAACNIRVLLLSQQHIPGLSECLDTYRKCVRNSTSTGDFGYQHEEAIVRDQDISMSPVPSYSILSETVYLALKTYMQENGLLASGSETLNRRAIVKNNSHIFVRQNGILTAGAARIYQIFIHRQNQYDIRKAGTPYLAIQRRLPSSPDILDPYLAYPIWGGRLYSNDFESSISVLPISSLWCHAALCPFDQQHTIVVPLDRFKPRPLEEEEEDEDRMEF